MKEASLNKWREALAKIDKSYEFYENVDITYACPRTNFKCEFMGGAYPCPDSARCQLQQKWTSK